MVLLRESSTLFRRVSEDTLHSMRGFGPLVDEEEGRAEGREGGRGDEGEGVELRITRMEEGGPAEAGEAWPALRSPSHAAAGGADATLVGRPPYASTAGAGHSHGCPRRKAAWWAPTRPT